MAAVLDASVVVELVLGTRIASSIRSRLSESRVSPHGPELVDLEVLNVLRRYVNAGAMVPSRAVKAISMFHELDIRRHRRSPMLHRVWAWRGNLTVYDAAYATLAEVLNATLLTTDARMANAPGLSIPIEVFTGETTH